MSYIDVFHPAPEIKAVVFDFDGTLALSPLDFGHMHRKARQALARYAEVPETLEGPILEDIDRICGELAPVTALLARHAAMEAIEEVEVEAAREGALFPFVRPMLAALRRADIAAAIITRNCRAAVTAVFPDVNEYAACVLTRKDVERVKPDPGHLLAALDKMGRPAGQSLMVGDHAMDILVGKRAGTLTAGVGSGNSSVEKLADWEPDFLAADAGELLRQLGLL